MNTYELIQKLAQYPPDTKIVLGFDWGEPMINDDYLYVRTEGGGDSASYEPCLNITNTPESQAKHSADLAARDEAVARKALETLV